MLEKKKDGIPTLTQQRSGNVGGTKIISSVRPNLPQWLERNQKPQTRPGICNLIKHTREWKRQQQETLILRQIN